MALQLIFLIASTYIPLTLAQLNFWGNEICYSDSDCSGLRQCDLTFGCQPSVWKIAVIAFSVVIFIGLAYCACYCLGFCGVFMAYRRNRSNIRNLTNPVNVQQTQPQNSGYGANVPYPSNNPYPTNVPYPSNNPNPSNDPNPSTVPYPTNVPYPPNSQYLPNNQYPSNNMPYPPQYTQYNQQMTVDPNIHQQESNIGFKQ